MNIQTLKFIVFLSLSCIWIAVAAAGNQPPTTQSADEVYVTGTIDDVNLESNLLKFNGVTYHYTSTTVIQFKEQGRTTEHSLSPGLHVRLIRKTSTGTGSGNYIELSEIIINDEPSK